MNKQNNLETYKELAEKEAINIYFNDEEYQNRYDTFEKFFNVWFVKES